MNARIPLVAFSVIALALLVSGCVSDQAPSGDASQEGSPEGQQLTTDQSNAVDNIASDIIGEDDTIEIGEMI